MLVPIHVNCHLFSCSNTNDQNQKCSRWWARGAVWCKRRPLASLLPVSVSPGALCANVVLCVGELDSEPTHDWNE